MMPAVLRSMAVASGREILAHFSDQVGRQRRGHSRALERDFQLHSGVAGAAGRLLHSLQVVVRRDHVLINNCRLSSESAN